MAREVTLVQIAEVGLIVSLCATLGSWVVVIGVVLMIIRRRYV